MYACFIVFIAWVFSRFNATCDGHGRGGMGRWVGVSAGGNMSMYASGSVTGD
jgi:hypothetical protein